jgi:hypothetical protein
LPARATCRIQHLAFDRQGHRRLANAKLLHGFARRQVHHGNQAFGGVGGVDHVVGNNRIITGLFEFWHGAFGHLHTEHVLTAVVVAAKHQQVTTAALHHHIHVFNRQPYRPLWHRPAVNHKRVVSGIEEVRPALVR